MERTKIRTLLLKSGASHLNSYGYSDCTTENILTDTVFSKLFKTLLRDNIGDSEEYDEVIDELIKEINSNKK